MVRYLIEGTASPQTFATLINDPHDRAEIHRPMFEHLGGTLESYFFGVGTDKYYMIISFDQPMDPLTLEAFWIASWAPGTLLSQQITQIITSSELVEALKKVSEIGFRPLGS